MDEALDYNVVICVFQTRAVSYAQSYLNNVKVRFIRFQCFCFS